MSNLIPSAKRPHRITALFIGLLLGLGISTIPGAPPRLEPLDRSFAQPPPSARPWVYWFWLNGNITSNGITADLEAMKRVGIGGVLIMEVDQGTPKGPAAFGGPEWRELFKHVCREANRLGLEVNMNNDAGWCGSGGPWITPELAMQKLVWTETEAPGGCRFTGQLSHPLTVSNYYADIAVLAFPTPADNTRIVNINAKAAFIPERLAPGTNVTGVAPQAIIPRERIVDLTSRLGTNGVLDWDVPAGKWTLLRLGHTPTGKDNHPAPEPGRGLECDKLSRAATDAMFNGLMGKLIADSKPLTGKTLVSTHIDSWETGSQNWTPQFRIEFKRLRGYDPLLYLPIVTGRVVGNPEVSERFLWDLRQTVSDLLIRNYAGRFRELAHHNGLRLSIEAYDLPPCDELTYAGQADEPMAEFWSYGYNTAYSCTEMASAAHVYGKRILGAEAFTASQSEKWLAHPASLKALGDWAFCEGINRFVFHRYALQPWMDVQPGMSMGPWGLHYERTQTWWEQSSGWHEYLARCQFLLRQGLFVADLCYLEPEGSPQRFTLNLPGESELTPERPAYNFDGCPPEVVLERMKIRDGLLVLPDGMNYRALVLPQIETMTPQLLRKIRDLARAGATVVGFPPTRSPSLSLYPDCDLEVRKLAEELWGKAEPETEYAERSFGKGRVISGASFRTVRQPDEPDKSPLSQARWIWYPEGKPAESAPVGHRYFKRTLILETNRTVTSAQLVMTADNAFELWVNGKRVGSGDNFHQTFKLDLKRFLGPGTNFIAVGGENGGENPNPAGLIGALRIEFTDSTALELNTDNQWQCSSDPGTNWLSPADAQTEWKAAMDLGPLGIDPWKVPVDSQRPLYDYPKFETIAATLAQNGVPPDFQSDKKFRYIHRRAGDVDLYFVANPATNWVGAQCAFRVSGKVPELWCPTTGRIKTQRIYQEISGRTFMPLWLEPAGSTFVVFRHSSVASRNKPGSVPVLTLKRDGRTVPPQPGTPEFASPSIELMDCFAPRGFGLAWQQGNYDWETVSGQVHHFDLRSLPQPLEVNSPWRVRFQSERGAPEELTFDTLTDWSLHTNSGVKYFSGHAVYNTSFSLPPAYLKPGQRVYLDLGVVAIIAQVKLNRHDLGTWWKPPFTADVTEALQSGENRLEIEVVNLWPNRMIGDEQLAEDSLRNTNGTLKEWPKWLQENQPKSSCRYTFTTWRLWKRDSPLQASGLLGPVRLVVAQQVPLND